MCNVFSNFESCFSAVAPSDPHLSGRVELAVALDDAGRVTSAAASGPLLASGGSLSACLESAAKKLVFAPRAGTGSPSFV